MSLTKRLNTCRRKGGLSTADLAQWFTLPYQTMRMYVEGRAEPYEARRPQIDARLVALEAAIKRGRHFPVPLDVRLTERKAYIADVMGAQRVNGHRR
jgi:hypothetical protein